MPQDDRNASYDGSAPILAFADTAEGRRRIATVMARIGGNAQVAPIDGALARLDEAVNTGAVLVDARGQGGDVLDRLLDRLERAAREELYASVVCIAPALIDDAAARASHRSVSLLVDPSEAEQGMALALAKHAARAGPSLREERKSSDLLQLSEEVGRIARTLAALSAVADRPFGMAAEPPATIDPPTAATVRAAIRARRLREQFFDSRLFADPAWDMLLDLMAARLEQRPVAVSSLCIAAAVPPTTALRWMKQLTDEGLFVRVGDPRDGRRIFIELSAAAAAGLSAYFQALGRMGVALP